MVTGTNKRIAKNTFILYFRMLLTMIIALYTSRIVLEQLGITDFGIYNVVGGLVTAFSFISVTLASATQRFFSYELEKGDIEQLNKLFNMVLIIHLALALVVFICMESLGQWFLLEKVNIPPNRISASRYVFQFTILSFVVTIIQVPYNACLVANERLNVYGYMSFVEVFFKLLIVYLLCWFPYDKLQLYAFLNFLVTLILGVVYIIYCRFNFQETKFYGFFNKSDCVKLLSYLSWSMYGNLAMVGYNQGINILLNIFFGPVVNAARAIAYQVSTAIMSFVTYFQLAINPQIVKSYASDKMEQMEILVFYGSKYSFFLLYALSLPVLLQTEFLLNLWLKITPPYAVVFCRLVVVNALVDAMAGILNMAAQAKGQLRNYQLIIGTGLLLNLPLSYFFLKEGYEPSIVFYVSILLAFCMLFVRLILLRGMINLNILEYFRKVLLVSAKVVFAGSLVPFLLATIVADNTMAGFLTVVISCLISSLLVIFICGLNREEKVFIYRCLKFK